jgi:predicted acylesterase/phospholipase RssA
MATKQREVRLALVLNGGVSLAVWIGGVTREIDAARRDFLDPADDKDTSGLYQDILRALKQTAVVDVIGGASAGGINGVLLGAAIFNRKPLPNLRETWIKIGDFRTLLRPPAPPDPPSLMKGDDVVLKELREVIAETYGEVATHWGRRLYVYVTATDLFGFPRDFKDSTGRRFEERDHRRIFGFQHEPNGDPPEAGGVDGALSTAIWLGDLLAPELLARAARSSSSFPVAFEPHRAKVIDADDQAHEHWLVDGGILDNQPFNPVLDRIAVLPAEQPVKRVVMYVVPYVTEVRKSGGGRRTPGSATSHAGGGKPPDDAEQLPEIATAGDTYSAAGKLPRDLPKLVELERVTRDEQEQKLAETTRTRVSRTVAPKEMAKLADALFRSYRQSRREAAGATFRTWTSETFRPGSGVLGNDPAVDPEMLRAVMAPVGPALPTGEVPWIPEKRTWPTFRQAVWTWGLSPAERTASWALLFLGDAASERPDGSELDRARQLASKLVWEARSAKEQLVKTFRARVDELRKTRSKIDAHALAIQAYKARPVQDALKRIQKGFRELDGEIEAANRGFRAGKSGYALRAQELLDFEVVQNAFTIDQLQVPHPFQFIFASAGIKNSLLHPADTPEKKLAGLKLNHFAGFLKRSWRANDWLWGRLDGVEHVLRAIVDLDRIRELQGEGAIEELAKAAFGRPEERPVLEGVWRGILQDYGIDEQAPGKSGFKKVLERALATTGDDADACFRACRRALAARIQLRILEKELERVAQTARDDVQSGASQIANGALWCGRVLDGRTLDRQRLLDLFRDMRIGSETLEDESSSRLVFDVGSQGAAVAAAMFAGDRGGLPAAARGMLGSVRGTSLTASRLIQLLARSPAVGAAIFFLLAALVVWAATARSTLVGALLPALAILAAVLGVAVLTLATSVFERSLAVLSFSRVLGFAVVVGVPLGFGLVVRWPKLSHAAAGWLDDNIGKTGTTIAAVLGFVAAAIAVFRLAAGIVVCVTEKASKEPRGRSWRRVVMGFYRWPVVGAFLTLLGGFMLERTLDRVNAGKGQWVGVAEERRGTILVLALLATLLLAALLIELVVPFRNRRRLSRPRDG